MAELVKRLVPQRGKSGKQRQFDPDKVANPTNVHKVLKEFRDNHPGYAGERLHLRYVSSNELQVITVDADQIDGDEFDYFSIAE